MELAQIVYKATGDFPDNERYGLTAQMRRSAVSVASNIAEGYGRESRGVFVQFLLVSQGSLKELETQAEIAMRVGFLDGINAESIFDQCEQTGKMLRGLIRSIQKRRADE
jgi:four helix bundle protein